MLVGGDDGGHGGGYITVLKQLNALFGKLTPENNRLDDRRGTQIEQRTAVLNLVRHVPIDEVAKHVDWRRTGGWSRTVVRSPRPKTGVGHSAMARRAAFVFLASRPAYYVQCEKDVPPTCMASNVRVSASLVEKPNSCTNFAAKVDSGLTL